MKHIKLSQKHSFLIAVSIIGMAAFSTGIIVFKKQKTQVLSIAQKGTPAKVSPAASQSPTPQTSVAAVGATPTPVPSASVGIKTPTQSSKPKSGSLPTPFYSPPPAWPPSVIYSVGRVEPVYTFCSDGALNYSLGGVNIYVNQATSAPFTWRLEVSDGTVSDSGTDIMPSGQTSWVPFPSTFDNPSSLGTIFNAEDGDMARLVITSPNYAAGAWSQAVPAGSQAACKNAQL